MDDSALQRAIRICRGDVTYTGDEKLLAKALIAMHERAERTQRAEAGATDHGVVQSLIGQLRRTIPHEECEDCWYSCSQHPDCCDDERKGNPCDCGAQNLNELHAHAADALERASMNSPR